jgi:hypothetical protein
MANFTVSDAVTTRFDGDFDITPAGGYTPGPEEQRYVDTMRSVMNGLAKDEENDKATHNGNAHRIRARGLRTAAAAKLRADATEFSNANLTARDAAENALVIKGRYLNARDRAARRLFVVELEHNDKKLAVDVTISVGDDPNDVPSPEKQKLFVALGSASTVITTVCRRIQERGTAREKMRGEQLLDEYIKKLSGVAEVGLEGPNVQLANLALEDLRSEFVAREAGRIKNAYVASLGWACAVAAAVCFGIYGIVSLGFLAETGFLGFVSFLFRHQNLLLAAGGAAIGTWLSFSIRRVALSFEDLAILEEDLLDPSVRVLFVIALTITACLLFVTGAMNIEIGQLKTASFVGPTALLIGVFFGIGERALATAISGRAASFVKGLGGGQ